MARLLCLHGFTGAPESWDVVRRHLPKGVEIVCPPLVGHDEDGAIDSACWDDEIDRLAELITDMGGRPDWHVAGYSLGGRLGLGLLVRYGELFRGGTLIGAHPGLETRREQAARRKADAALALRLERGILPFVKTWESLPLFASQRELPHEVQAAQRERRLRHRPSGLVRSLRAVGLGEMPNLRPALPTLEISVRLVVGARDPKFRAVADEMARLLPRVKVEIVPGAGHNVVLEAPERVAAVIRGGLS